MGGGLRYFSKLGEIVTGRCSFNGCQAELGPVVADLHSKGNAIREVLIPMIEREAIANSVIPKAGAVASLGFHLT